MTVSRHRRRMSTTRALIASLIGVVLAVGFGIAGAVAIYNTKDGQVQGSDTPEVSFPSTPTGAIAVLDANGALASLAVLAIRPAEEDEPGRGGTVVPVPVSADVSGGLGVERLPIDETVSLFGAESVAEELPALLGVSIDRIAVVTEGELAAMLAPLIATSVGLPLAATRDDGTVIAEAGPQSLDGAAMAAVLASRAAARPAADEYLNQSAVWSAIAEAVGEGLASPLALQAATTGGAESAPQIGELVGRLTSGPISVQVLRSDPIVSVDVNPRGVDAVALDRVEVAVIFGHIAPSRVAAPYAGYTIRVVSAYRDEELPAGVARLDVAYTATKAFVGLEANVRSVDTVAGDVEASTIVEVANDSLVAAGESLGGVFGSVEVRVGDTRINGIDMVVTLGTDYLATLDPSAAPATTVPPSAPVDGSAGTVGTDTTTVEGTN